MAPPKDIVPIDLTSPEPENKPKEPIFLDLTGDSSDESEFPLKKPLSSSNNRPSKPSLSGLTPSASSSSKATPGPSRSHASSVFRSTPSSSNATTSSRRLNLDERSFASPAIKDSPKSSQHTRKDPSALAPKPRFRVSSPVPDGHPSSNFSNLPGLERQTQSLPKPALKKSQKQHPRNESDSNGARPGTSQPKSAASRPRPKEVRPEPPSKQETTQPQRNSIAPEPKQPKLVSTHPQTKETQPESSQPKPLGIRAQQKEARPESSRSNPEATRSHGNSISPEPEHPRRKILQPKSRLSQPASRISTPLANFLSPSFDEDTDRQPDARTRGPRPREASKERGRSASGVSVGGPSSRLDSSSKASGRVPTQVDSSKLKVLSHTAQHTPRKHLQCARVFHRNSIPADDSTAEQDVEIEEVLRSLKKEMETNHAFNVHFLLEDASETVTKAHGESRFMDNVSPFVSMKPIESSVALANAPILYSFKTVTSDQKSKSPATSYTMSKRILPDYEPIPCYTSLTFFHRNLLSPDDEKLRSMPQENEQTNKGKALEEELRKTYSQKHETSGEMEYRKRLQGHIDFWLEECNIQCTRRDLENYLITRNSFGTYVKETQKSLKKAYKKAAPRIVKLKTQLNAEICKICRGFSMAFESVFEISLCAVLLPTNRIKELFRLELNKTCRKSLDHQQSIATKGPMFAVETYTNLMCLICGALDCQIHGEFSEMVQHYNEGSDGSEESEANDDEEEKGDEREIKFLTQPERITLQADDLLRKHLERRANMKETGTGNENDKKRCRRPCSPDCHLVVGAGGDVPRQLTERDINDISLMLISLKYTIGRCCDIAFSLSIPCFQAFREIDRQERADTQIDLIPPPPLSKAEIESHRPSWYDSREKKLKGEWREMTTMHSWEKMTQANPCHHAGPCSKDTNCECFSRSILCEDMCSCSDDCPRRFTGCSCHSNASGKFCEKDTCICIQLNRECGPHCHNCGALERLDPANRYNDDLFAKGCQNLGIQRGVPKVTIAGISQIAGHGLYAGEFMPKNSYIDEYVGEIISCGEAERRGIIYDHNFVSFLFNLNQDWVLDGHYLSNKTRYINHASQAENGLNCKAVPLWVNGEHRIKFVALRDIDAGEELLFDYGKQFADTHGLNKTLPKTKSLSKKAAAVTDGESSGTVKRGIRRGRGGTASRGACGNTGRARKHGSQKKSVVEDEDPEEAEDGEDDYEDVGAADGRPRCVCKQPGCGKMYTRIDNLRTHKRLVHGMDV